MLARSRAERLDLCRAGAGTRRLWTKLWIFGPRLYDEVGVERFDHVARRLAVLLRKSGHMVPVPVGGDDGMELPLGPLLDVLGDVHHARLRHPLGKARGSEIDQDVLFRRGAVGETDQKAVAESDVIRADGRALGGFGHGDLLCHEAHAMQLGEW